MGSGEDYLGNIWPKWTQGKSKEELVEYFESYLPLPLDWLDMVAYEFGYEEIFDEMLSGQGDFAGIKWLEQQGLAKFSEFMEWYEQSGFRPQE